MVLLEWPHTMLGCAAGGQSVEDTVKRHARSVCVCLCFPAGKNIRRKRPIVGFVIQALVVSNNPCDCKLAFQLFFK